MNFAINLARIDSFTLWSLCVDLVVLNRLEQTRVMYGPLHAKTHEASPRFGAYERRFSFPVDSPSILQHAGQSRSAAVPF